MKPIAPEKHIWWKSGVIYHIYMRSFSDFNGDGIGDLQGVIQKLPYLSDLGIDAIWLSPVFSSPNVDFGYDVSDYFTIEPTLGSADDFNQLISKAHNLGIRVIMDMVMNHTSELHSWFKESRSSPSNSKRNWYIWREGVNGKPPNNWKSASGGSAWKLDLYTNTYYLHSFFSQQPDLNWRNPEVIEAFIGIVKFWLDKGVDGFRFDVINLIIKDKKFRDNPNFLMLPVFQQHVYTRNRARSHKILKKLRQVIDEYEERMTIGEIYMNPPGDQTVAANYLGKGDDSLNMAFDFSLIFKPWNARNYFQAIKNWQEQIPENGWPCHVLSNHDLFRNINRIPWRTNKREKAKVAAVLLLTLRGTPFIYYGDEIGMGNSRIPKKSIRDPFGKQYWPFFSGRDKARTPMQWAGGLNAGFSTARPWLPVERGYKIINVESEQGNENSIYHVYRKVIWLRRQHPSLQIGEWVPLLNGGRGVLGYLRKTENEKTFILLNFTSRIERISLPEHLCGEVLFSTQRPTGDLYYFDGFSILPFEAIILFAIPG